MINVPRDKCMIALSDVIHELSSSNQHEHVLHHIVDRIVRLYKCRTCAVVLIDPGTEYLSIENSFGLSWTFCKAFRRTLATGVVGELLWTAKPLLVTDSTDDPQLSSELQLEFPFASCIAVQIAIDHRTCGYLFADSEERGMFTPDDLVVFRGFADVAGLAMDKARLHEQNIRMDRIDHETGIEKYIAFLERLETGLARARHTGSPLAAMILDVDNFKQMTGTYGSSTTSVFLKELAELLRTHLRPIDACGRYGADEFIVMLENMTLDDAVTMAKSLARAVQEAEFTPSRIRSSISVGVAAFPQNGHTSKDVILTAKNAVFEAQRAGRNNVYHYITDWQAAHPVLVHNE